MAVFYAPGWERAVTILKEGSTSKCFQFTLSQRHVWQLEALSLRSRIFDFAAFKPSSTSPIHWDRFSYSAEFKPKNDLKHNELIYLEMLLQLSPEENFRLYFHLTSLLSVIWCTWSNLLLASVWTGGHALMTAKHPIIWEALKERKENKIKDRESLCLDCFGNIVLNCHANEEQWTEENIGETDRVGGRELLKFIIPYGSTIVHH